MICVVFSEAKAGSDVLPFSSLRLLLFLKVEQNSLCIFFSLQQYDWFDSLQEVTDSATMFKYRYHVNMEQKLARFLLSLETAPCCLFPA